MPKYVLNSLLAGIFSVTFTASPYAYADKTQNSKTEKKSSMTRLKAQIKDAKITTAKSYPEFFMRLSQQNKSVNPHVFRQIAEAMSREKYPATQIQEFTYKGKDALKVMTQVGKEQVVIEYLFNGSDVMKINGTLFKTVDTTTAQAFDAKLKTIPAFHKIYQDFQKRVFKTAKVPTYKQWTKLSRAQRAEYFMRYRMLLEAAYKVHGTGPFKVVGNEYKTFEEWVQSTFFGSEAYAGPAPDSVGAPAARVEAEAVEKARRLSDGLGNRTPFVSAGDPSGRGPSCIVAGYARQWKGETCPWDAGNSQGRKNFYDENPTSIECKTGKGDGWIACNPLIYGYNAGGSPHCINANDKAQINIATHGLGPCEDQSPLKTPANKMAFIKNILKRENVPGRDTLKCKDAQGNKKDICAENDILITTDKPLFEKIMKELSGPIGEYIKSAETICEENKSRWNYKSENKPRSSKPDPAYQDEACDALMKRAIAVQNLLTVDDTNPLAGGPCDGWAPADQVEEQTNSDGTKVCVCKKAPSECNQDNVNKTCGPIEKIGESTEVTEITPSSTLEDGADCGSYFARMNPTVSECSSTAGDWFKTIFGAIAAVCVGNYFTKGDLFGICEKGDGGHRSRITKYTDPVSPCPATGCPEVPTTPENPTTPEEPRAEEEITNQNNPVYNPIQVPPR